VAEGKGLGVNGQGQEYSSNWA